MCYTFYMGLFKTKSKIITIFNDTKDVVVLAYDDRITLGQELVVEENQLGIAMFNDKFCDVLPAGTHSLSSSNLPLLCSLQKIKKKGKDKERKLGKKIEGDIYIVTKEQMSYDDLTSYEFVLRDKKFGRIEGKARFSIVVKVAEPLKFLKALRSLVSLVSRGKAKLLTADIIKDLVAETIQKSILFSDITDNLVEIKILQKLVEKLKFMGLDVINFNMLGFVLPNKLKKFFASGSENSKPSISMPRPNTNINEIGFQKVGKQCDGDKEIPVTLIKSNEKSAGSALLSVDSSVEKKGLDINFNQLLGKGEFEGQVIICPNCGKVMKQGDKFCSVCAYRLDNLTEGE